MAENWHKRHAIMLASQLPDNASDANAVIRNCRTSLIRGCIPRRLPSRPRYLVWSAIRPERAYATQGPPVHAGGFFAGGCAARNQSSVSFASGSRWLETTPLRQGVFEAFAGYGNGSTFGHSRR